VLHGNSWGQPEIVNLSPDDRIKPGEPVVTSGGDSIYPRGLPVGSVDRTVSQPEGTLINVLIKPAANLEKLEEVLVITSSGSQMSSAMQQDLSDAQEKASDILAERLPSRADPNAPQSGASATSGTSAAQGTPAGSNAPDTALPTPPPKPPAALHPDRYSSSSVRPADEMVPGQRSAAPASTTTPDSSTEAQPANPAPVKHHTEPPASSSAAPSDDGGQPARAPQSQSGAARPKPQPSQPQSTPSQQPASPQGTN
jgi:rod shape-determining protein MreC